MTRKDDPKTMIEKGAYRAFAKVLQKEGRQVHVNLRRGLFVLSSDRKSYHDITLTEYPIPGANARQLPRLIINRDWSTRRLPDTVAKKWHLKPSHAGLFDSLDLKLTFLPINLESIAKALPMIIGHMERGNRDGFEEFLTYKAIAFTPLSIWSFEADTFAKSGKYMEPDPATMVHVNRNGTEQGSFYLSQIELGLKRGDFTESDIGQVDGCGEWLPLPQLTKSLRSINGKKNRATSNQRAYLERCGFSLWRGISNREASHMISSLTQNYGIPPGKWINYQPTEKQNSVLANVCSGPSPALTRGDASLAIEELFDQSPQVQDFTGDQRSGK